MPIDAKDIDPQSISRAEVREILAQLLGPDRVPSRFKIITDTTDFFRVDYNDVVALAGRLYLVQGYTREGRFGLDDEPKYWVRRARDLADGSSKIIKMVFHEWIDARVGDLVFPCLRSPSKEAVILDLVKDHPNFMHGVGVRDAAGNIIRILDFIRGSGLDEYVRKLNKGHEEYFFTQFAALLDQFIELVEAIGFLHRSGQKHGDIRRDHVLIDREMNIYRWIDFDYDYLHAASMFGYDLFGLGNILVFLAGGADVTVQRLAQEEASTYGRLHDDDLNIVINNRVANLQKIYPYIPDDLNYVLLHFSKGANIFYETTEELVADLRAVKIN